MFFRKTSYKHLFFDKQNIYVFGVDVPNISVKHFNYLFLSGKTSIKHLPFTNLNKHIIFVPIPSYYLPKIVFFFSNCFINSFFNICIIYSCYFTPVVHNPLFFNNARNALPIAAWKTPIYRDIEKRKEF
uniref:Uncharacterized protein n=1 Tax=Meloidogyne enterolobii TaxID=390850 RepID=A0A6V7TYW8_MELEN|nr:unnamed protein product [Meloidogyne enterolobii]